MDFSWYFIQVLIVWRTHSLTWSSLKGCYSIWRPKVHGSHEWLELGIRKSAKIKAATFSILSLPSSHKHSNHTFQIRFFDISLHSCLSWLHIGACGLKGPLHWDKYFLLLVAQHLVSDLEAVWRELLAQDVLCFLGQLWPRGHGNLSPCSLVTFCEQEGGTSRCGQWRWGETGCVPQGKKKSSDKIQWKKTKFLHMYDRWWSPDELGWLKLDSPQCPVPWPQFTWFTWSIFTW